MSDPSESDSEVTDTLQNHPLEPDSVGIRPQGRKEHYEYLQSSIANSEVIKGVNKRYGD
jgi:hypothetical protein